MLGAIQMVANQPRAQMLGALSPDIQLDLESTLLALDDLYAQALGDLVTLADLAVDPALVGELRTELDGYAEQVLQQRGELIDLDDAEAPEWRATSARLHGQLMACLRRTGEMRAGTLSSQQRRGLWWGLGVAAGAFAIGTVVWTQRKRRRRKT